MKGTVGFQPAHGNQWCLWGGSGRGEGGGEGAAAVYRSLIYDLLSFACVFTGFWELHSIRAAGVRSMFFCEDKLKLDTFISASAAEEPVTAYQKSFSLITRLKVWEIVTVPDK